MRVAVGMCIQVFSDTEGKGWFFVMDHLNISQLRKHSGAFGEQLAR